MENILRLFIPVACYTLFLFYNRKRAVFKGFKCFCRVKTPVIGMTVYAGVGVDPSVKQNLGGIFWKQTACHIPNADITLFMTADTLN